MAQMDQLYKTSFSEWVRSEDNINYVCTMKGNMIREALLDDREACIYGLRWMSANYSVPSFAEMMLKLFYSMGMASSRFVSILHDLTVDWQHEKIIDLLSVILVGEKPVSVSNFVKHWIYYSGWKRDDMAELLLSLKEAMRWNQSYCKELLTELVFLLIRNGVAQRSLMMVIEDELKEQDDLSIRGKSLAFTLAKKHSIDTFVLIFELIYQESCT
ncbi:hypothetical protein EDD86DRAFT_205889 [Gorgonomyces haynaldii]|nr:hypothetical protein EDD86DRAFT_205889 [Gorgonomyces haynaldii]